MQKLIPQFSAIVPGIDENGSLCLDYEVWKVNPPYILLTVSELDNYS